MSDGTAARLVRAKIRVHVSGGVGAQSSCAAARHSRAVLIAKPDGKWSAQEHAGRLLDLEPLWLARVRDYVAGNAGLTAANLTNRKTHEAEAALFGRAIPHPRLRTPIRLVDHLYFVAEHDDHHLAAIWELPR